MKENNLIADKSFAFGLRVVKLYQYLRAQKIDIGFCSQLLSSGTSIGANVEEAIGGSSRRDFKHKLEIAYREARESRYWLRLLRDAEIIQKNLADSLIGDCEELIKILTAILNTLKEDS